MKIKEMFRNKGFKITKEKKIQIEKSEAEKFYKVHETKPFYNDLCLFIIGSNCGYGFGKRKCCIGQQRIDGCY